MIRLIGPGGAGKSTVGASLAAQLQWRFVDLDRVFERRYTDIGAFIAAHGYAAYARENVEAYLAIPLDHPGCVLALSSGFMAFPASVHPKYPAVREAVACDPETFVLLPCLDRDARVTETVRRQLHPADQPPGRRPRAGSDRRALRSLCGVAGYEGRDHAPRDRGRGGDSRAASGGRARVLSGSNSGARPRPRDLTDSYAAQETT